MEVHNRPCATCSERKVACDRVKPACRACVLSKRACRPPRLIWPTQKHHRRAIVREPKAHLPRQGSFEFVHASFHDLEIYHGNYSLRLARRFGMSILASPLSTPQYNSLASSGDAELLPYFFTITLPTLPAFGIDRTRLCALIARSIFIDDSDPSRAVLNSLLAWANLHKHGHTRTAFRLVVSSLASLRRSLSKGIRNREALQHVIAGILMCSFEMHCQSRDPTSWLLYLSGIKSIISHFFAHASLNDDEIILLQWVLYLDTFAQLGLKHAAANRKVRAELDQSIKIPKVFSSLPKFQTTGYCIGAHKILGLLSEFNNQVLSPESPGYRAPGYQSWLAGVERNLVCIRRELRLASPESDKDHSESVTVRDLFALATLIYVERKSTQLVGSSIKTDTWVNEAFSILRNIECCNKPFPLFVLGLEAQTDKRRQVILKIITQTTTSLKESNRLCSLRRLLSHVWVQQDLRAGDVDTGGADNCPFFLNAHDFVPCLV